uniref:Uncharacterized protein n=1 Tax=viral metagenome TaxID=1070528 RepID=A0A6C0HI87_9ZZZZ
MKTSNINRGYNRFSKKYKKTRFSKNKRKTYNKKTRKSQEGGGKWGILPSFLTKTTTTTDETQNTDNGKWGISFHSNPRQTTDEGYVASEKSLSTDSMHSIASNLLSDTRSRLPIVPSSVLQRIQLASSGTPIQTNAAQRYKYPVIDIFWQLFKINNKNDATYIKTHEAKLIYLIQNDIETNYALILLLYNLGEVFDKNPPSDALEYATSETDDSSIEDTTEIDMHQAESSVEIEDKLDKETANNILARYILLFEKFRREQKIKFEDYMYIQDNTKVVFEDSETLKNLLILFKNIMDKNRQLIEQAKQLQNTSNLDGEKLKIQMDIRDINKYAILCTRHLPSCNNAVETLGAVIGRKALEPFLTSNGIIRGLELAIGTPTIGCSDSEYGNPYIDTELKAALNWNQLTSETASGISSDESFFKLIKSKPGRLLVYVSNLIRTWMTASILYGCSDIGISYELVLIVAPHLKEHHLTTLTKEVRRGNYPIDIETQINYFKQFLQIVYNFCDKKGIKMVKTIHIKFPMVNTRRSGEDPRDFITFTIKLGTSINSSSTNFVSSYDYYGLSEELTGTTPTVSEPFTSFYSKKNYTQNGNLMHFFNWLNIHHAYIIGELNKHANETNQISQNQMILMVAHSNIMQAFAKYLNTPPNRATYETNAWSIFIKQNMLSDVIVNRKHHFIPILGVPQSCSTDLGWANDKICNPTGNDRNSLENGSIVWKHTSTNKYQTVPQYLRVGGKSPRKQKYNKTRKHSKKY